MRHKPDVHFTLSHVQQVRLLMMFGRIVLRRLKSATSLDPMQFAYRENRSVDDAVALGLHHILQHLEASATYARILFIDYSSAFNTIVPQKLFQKLLDMDVDHSLCLWVLDFLTDRPQTVRIGDKVSLSLTLNVGTPQGCVLSPSLYSLFTNDCVSHSDSVKLIKFADDTTVEGLISGGDESVYRGEVDRLVSWCSDNNLELNVKKTKEMIVDFRKKKGAPLQPLVINSQAVEMVDNFKFLGTVIDSDLKWEDNCTAIVKKAQQRLYFLRQLKKFGLSKDIMVQFYRAVVESVLTFSITVWYGSTSKQDRDRLERVVKSASRIIGRQLPSIASIYADRSTSRARKIAADQSHPANHLFQLLPSGRRYRALRTRTERFKNSFYPHAVRTLSA